MQERSQLEEQLEYVKGNALEEAKIRSDIAKIDGEISKDMVDFRIDEEKRWLTEKERLAKEEADALREQSKLEYDALYDDIVQSQTERLDAANEEIKNAERTSSIDQLGGRDSIHGQKIIIQIK